MKAIILKILAFFESLFLAGRSATYIPRMPPGVGGPLSFIQLLRGRFEQKGIRITNNRYTRFDSALIPISADLKMLQHWKRKGVKITQRLDGVFYDHSTGSFDAAKNQNIPSIYHGLADGIIFQSDYSRLQCLHFMGEPAVSHSEVIYNGTDLDTYFPAEPEKKVGNRWKVVSTGNFRDASMILPALAAVNILIDEGLDITWRIIGPILNDEWIKKIDEPNIEWLPNANRKVIADVLRSSDVFLFSFLNPNCPNSVIEATACGLPVVSFNSGAMAELCDFNRELLADVNDSIIQLESDLKPDRLADKMRLVFKNYSTYKQNVIDNRQRFSIETAANKYIDFMTTLK